MSRAKRQRQKENTRQAREAREAAAKRDRRKKTVIRVGVAAVIVAAVVLVVSLLTDDDGDDVAATDPSSTTLSTPTTAANADVILTPGVDYSAKVTTNLGEIDIDLDETGAPIATSHFVTLANEGFYDGLTFHRVIDDFMIQGGDPAGDGSGGSGRSVVGETPTDGYPVGSLAAAKTGADPAGTFDAQFFIVTGTQTTQLGSDYARFGSVTAGQDIAQQIEDLAPTDGSGDVPTQPVTIESIEIIETPVEDISDTGDTTVPSDTTTVAP